MRAPERHLLSARPGRYRKCRHVQHRDARPSGLGASQNIGTGGGSAGSASAQLIAAVALLAVAVAVKLTARAAAEQRQPDLVLHHQLVALQRGRPGAIRETRR